MSEAWNDMVVDQRQVGIEVGLSSGDPFPLDIVHHSIPNGEFAGPLFVSKVFRHPNRVGRRCNGLNVRPPQTIARPSKALDHSPIRHRGLEQPCQFVTGNIPRRPGECGPSNSNLLRAVSAHQYGGNTVEYSSEDGPAQEVCEHFRWNAATAHERYFPFEASSSVCWGDELIALAMRPVASMKYVQSQLE